MEPHYSKDIRAEIKDFSTILTWYPTESEISEMGQDALDKILERRSQFPKILQKAGWGQGSVIRRGSVLIFQIDTKKRLDERRVAQIIQLWIEKSEKIPELEQQ